ncbi:hypothetical protein RND81_12G089700 [Saponaria officinalis]|uniref:Uncharacterized protein n=1 Tax=Saponaria officinalis TaxID=3572 RepID=A0AAW1H8C4_SAPOF
MVHFNDHNDGAQRYLCIIYDEECPGTTTRLPIYKSSLRADGCRDYTITSSDYPEHMTLPFRTAHQSVNGYTLISTLPTQPVKDTKFSLLGRGILSDKARWGSRVIQVHGEAVYIEV